MLNKLYEYSCIWYIKVNTDKTKVMVVEKGRKIDDNLYYNDSLLEVVDNFKFLGVMLYRNDSWNRKQKCLSEYGSFALHNLNRLFQNITLFYEENIKLFDSLVARSKLNYAAKVRGKDVERLHIRFCRSLLGVL